ncbi:DUF4845 domain-containing protein [Marinimicrobium locisalis]|uniref:DUF4845 domain-containing protein n=1 Tax=Marinimicrobium locisalis TaxID=546022 RepID=UPI0032217B11
MQLPKQQRGMSTLGVVFVILVAVAVVFTAFKVVPPYAENRYISSALKSLAKNNPDLFSLSPSQIRSQLTKFYTVNNVRTEGRKNIDIDKHASRVVITIAYEERIDFVRNIDLVFSFNNQLDSSAPEQCCTPLERNLSND